MDNGDRNSDCNSGGDISFDGMQPTISFLCRFVSTYIYLNNLVALQISEKQAVAKTCHVLKHFEGFSSFMEGVYSLHIT